MPTVKDFLDWLESHGVELPPGTVVVQPEALVSAPDKDLPIRVGGVKPSGGHFSYVLVDKDAEKPKG